MKKRKNHKKNDHQKVQLSLKQDNTQVLVLKNGRAASIRCISIQISLSFEPLLRGTEHWQQAIFSML